MGIHSIHAISLDLWSSSTALGFQTYYWNDLFFSRFLAMKISKKSHWGRVMMGGLGSPTLKYIFSGLTDRKSIGWFNFVFWYKSCWWFQIFFIFTPKIGEMIQFDQYLWDGLKLPTSNEWKIHGLTFNFRWLKCVFLPVGFITIQAGHVGNILPKNLTVRPWKRKIVSQQPILRGHVSFSECSRFSGMFFFSKPSFKEQSRMSNEKNPGCLRYMGDYTIQLYRDYNKPWCIMIPY